MLQTRNTSSRPKSTLSGFQTTPAFQIMKVASNPPNTYENQVFKTTEKYMYQQPITPE